MGNLQTAGSTPETNGAIHKEAQGPCEKERSSKNKKNQCAPFV